MARAGTAPGPIDEIPSPMGGPTTSALVAKISQLLDVSDLETVRIIEIREQLEDHFGQSLDKRFIKGLVTHVLSANVYAGEAKADGPKADEQQADEEVDAEARPCFPVTHGPAVEYSREFIAGRESIAGQASTQCPGMDAATSSIVHRAVLTMGPEALGAFIEQTEGASASHMRKLCEAHARRAEAPATPTTTAAKSHAPTLTATKAGGASWTESLSIAELMTKSTAELKELCRQANVPVTGNKETLASYLLDPAAHQKGSKSKPRSLGGGRLSTQRVDALFAAAGVKDTGRINPCLKAGVQRGFVKLASDGSIDLDAVILLAECHCCSEEVSCTVRDALHQSTYGGCDYGDGGEGAAVQCPSGECGGNYITGLCDNNAHFDSGKAHNHCTQCPGFGKCIGDYREAHCGQCNKHYFRGSMGGDCSNCARKGLGSKRGRGEYEDGFFF